MRLVVSRAAERTEGGEGGVRMPGARGAAAKEAFRQEVLKHPLGVARAVYYQNMSASPSADLLSPGTSRGPSMRAYMTQETPFGFYKTLTYLGFVLAQAFDWLMEGEGNLDKVKCLLSLACAAVDQVALDGGSWVLASHLLNLPEPPWAYTSQNTPQHSQSPFSKLVDPRWTAAIKGYIKDLEALRSQRGSGKRHQDTVPPGRLPRGPKGAGGKGDTGAAPAASA